VLIGCGSFNDGECHSNGFLSCYWSESSSLCQSKEECEGSGAGRCTDSDYFVNYLTSPPTFGSCVVPFQVDGNRSYCFENTIPLSLGYAGMKDFAIFVEKSPFM